MRYPVDLSIIATFDLLPLDVAIKENVILNKGTFLCSKSSATSQGKIHKSPRIIRLLIVISFVATQFVFSAPSYAGWVRLVHRFDPGKDARIYNNSSFISEISFLNTLEAKDQKGLIVKLVSVTSNCAVNNTSASLDSQKNFKFRFSTGPAVGNVHLKYVIGGPNVPEQALYFDAKIQQRPKTEPADTVKNIALLAFYLGTNTAPAYSEAAVKEDESYVLKESFADIYLNDRQGPARGITIDHKIDGSTSTNNRFTTKITLIGPHSEPILNEGVKIEFILPSKDFHLDKSFDRDDKGYYSFDIDAPSEPEIARFIYKITFPDGTVKYVPEKIIISEGNIESFIGTLSIGGGVFCAGAGFLNWLGGGIAALGNGPEQAAKEYDPYTTAWFGASLQLLGTGLLFVNANSFQWQDLERYSGTHEADDVVYSNKMNNRLIDSPEKIRQNNSYPHNPNDLEYPDSFGGNALILGGSVNGGYQFGLEHNFNKRFGLHLSGSLFNGDHGVKVSNNELLLYFRFFRGFNYFLYAGTGLGQATRDDEKFYYKSFTDSEMDTFAVMPFKIGLEMILIPPCSLYLDVESLISGRNPINYGNIGLKLYF